MAATSSAGASHSQFTAPSMQHIDRRELYTSLPARVRYLHSFLDFNSEDQAALQLAAKYIKALVPAIVNIVYKKLLSYDITARAFTIRSTSYEGPIDEIPMEESPQIKHRKQFLRGYLYRLCTDPTKMEFWEYLDKVGMMHVGQGRKHPLHVEYIHIGLLLGFVHDVITEAILGHPKLSLEVKTKVLRAVGKVLWIQNDLFAKWYVRDGAEFQDESSDEEEIEPEGYLHGRKIVTTGEDGESAPEGSGSNVPTGHPHVKLEDRDVTMGGCPFSAMGATMGSSNEEVAAK